MVQSINIENLLNLFGISLNFSKYSSSCFGGRSRSSTSSSVAFAQVPDFEIGDQKPVTNKKNKVISVLKSPFNLLKFPLNKFSQITTGGNLSGAEEILRWATSILALSVSASYLIFSQANSDPTKNCGKTQQASIQEKVSGGIVALIGLWSCLNLVYCSIQQIKNNNILIDPFIENIHCKILENLKTNYEIMCAILQNLENENHSQNTEKINIINKQINKNLTMQDFIKNEINQKDNSNKEQKITKIEQEELEKYQNFLVKQRDTLLKDNISVDLDLISICQYIYIISSFGDSQKSFQDNQNSILGILDKEIVKKSLKITEIKDKIQNSYFLSFKKNNKLKLEKQKAKITLQSLCVFYKKLSNISFENKVDEMEEKKILFILKKNIQKHLEHLTNLIKNSVAFSCGEIVGDSADNILAVVFELAAIEKKITRRVFATVDFIEDFSLVSFYEILKEIKVLKCYLYYQMIIIEFCQANQKNFSSFINQTSDLPNLFLSLKELKKKHNFFSFDEISGGAFHRTFLTMKKYFYQIILTSLFIPRFFFYDSIVSTLFPMITSKFLGLYAMYETKNIEAEIEQIICFLQSNNLKNNEKQTNPMKKMRYVKWFAMITAIFTYKIMDPVSSFFLKTYCNESSFGHKNLSQENAKFLINLALVLGIARNSIGAFMNLVEQKIFKNIIASESDILHEIIHFLEKDFIGSQENINTNSQGNFNTNSQENFNKESLEEIPFIDHDTSEEENENKQNFLSKTTFINLDEITGVKSQQS